MVEGGEGDFDALCERNRKFDSGPTLAKTLRLDVQFEQSLREWLTLSDLPDPRDALTARES